MVEEEERPSFLEETPDPPPPSYLYEFWQYLTLFLPIFANSGAYFAIGVIQLLFVGHLGETVMASTALATSICNVTGYSIGVGLLGAMDTLVSQAHGAKDHKKIGEVTLQSLIGLLLYSFLILPVWMYSEPLLLLLGQRPEVADLSSQFIRIGWLGLFPSGIMSVSRRYLQHQNVIFPIFLVGLFSVTFSTVSMTLLMFVFDMGAYSAPIAVVMTNFATATFFLVYIYLLDMWKINAVPISINLFKNMVPWFKLAIPGVVMCCAEWWGVELHIIIAGIFGVEQLAAMTLLITVISFVFTIPLSISFTASTKIGNALGEGNIPLAKRYTLITAGLAFGLDASISLLLYCTRYYWPYFFTDEEKVIDVVLSVAPIAFSWSVVDSVQTALAGVLRGTGKQKVGAYTYLGAYYGIGMTTALILAFYFELEIFGQWIGMLSAALACFIVLGSYTAFFLNWEEVLMELKERSSMAPEDTMPLSTEKEVEMNIIV